MQFHLSRLQQAGIVGTAIGLLCFASPSFAGPPVPSLNPSSGGPETEILITINARSFHPAAVPIQAGHKIRLVFQNQDAELHAFVPLELLKGLHLNISGAGAPQFDQEGLKRVIIPPQGRAEIRFVPVRPGTYAYYCDMPGHQMSGTITVTQQ